MKLFLLVLALTCLATAAPRTKNISNGKNSLSSYESKDLQVRSQSPGIIGILEAFIGVLENALKLMNGEAKAADFAQSLANLFTTLEQMISIKGIVSEVPVVGGVLASVCDGASAIFKNVPMLGGLIDQVITGGTSDEIEADA